MASQIELKDAKIYLLYLLDNIGYPIEFYTLNEIVLEDDYIIYLDFAQAFADLLDKKLIVEQGRNGSGEPLYTVSREGAFVARELKSDIYPDLLNKSLRSALRYLDFKKRNVTARAYHEKLDNGKCKLSIELNEKDSSLLDLSLTVDSEDRAVWIEHNFQNDPEKMYKAIISLLQGSEKLIF